jgi:hypothetical protein
MIISRRRQSLIAPWLELSTSYLSIDIYIESELKHMTIRKGQEKKRTIKFVWPCRGHIDRCLVTYNIHIQKENKILELLMMMIR